MLEYKRPEVSEAQAKLIRQQVDKLMRADTHRISTWMKAIMVENASLLAEVNEHRAARGYALLEAHE